MINRQLRYRDLKERGVVPNRVTLGNWIDKCGFPHGRLVGPNTRLWDEEEVVAWLASRPTEKKSAPMRRCMLIGLASTPSERGA
jgi:predicted DNA-binding transcriptional regulator AlpA